MRQIIADGIGQYEVTVGQSLHEGRCTEAVGTVVGEVGLADGVKAGNGGHQVVIHPDAAHGIVYGRINHHRLLVRVHVGNLFVHLEQVAVAGLDDILAEPFDSGLEVEEYGEPRFVHAETGIATLLGGTGSHVAGNEVTERRIPAFEVVIPVLLRDFGSLFEFGAELLHILLLLGYPDAAVVAERLRHERQLALVFAVHRNTGRVYLREAGVGKHRPLLVALPGGRTVGVHRIGREEEDVAVTARGDNHGVCAEPFDFARHEVAGDDAAGLAVNKHQVEHLMARIAFHRPFGYLPVERRISAEQKLLSRLAAGIEGTRYLRAAERTARRSRVRTARPVRRTGR